MRYVVRGESVFLKQRTVCGIKGPAPVQRFVAFRPHVHRFVPGSRGHDGALVGVNVVKLGPRSLLRLANPHRLAGQQLPDFAIHLIEISGDNRVLRTDHHAGRFQSHLGTMGAEMTFGGCSLVRIDVDGVVRAGLHAGFAANTAFGTEVHDPIFALVHRRDRTDGHARRILAMIAAGHLEDAASVGKVPFSTYFTQVRFTVSGTWFSVLHATVQA